MVCPPEVHCLVVTHRAEQISFRWPFDVSLFRLPAILIDKEVKFVCICSLLASLETNNVYNIGKIMDYLLDKGIEEEAIINAFISTMDHMAICCS